ncbi:hypothetical protein [Microbacterium oxydans]|uniref:hypothetical protein n=1 Tax=Microbacterium oxydans TaxID=82380 RepID=UPI001E2E9CA9|nr:hypothetical protein [Microbacterium oxydans]
MTSSRPFRPLILCTLTFAASTLLGCSPTPAPTPSPTPAFASEEEAFAAAEETYRAYVNTVNLERQSRATERSTGFLTGDLLSSEVEAQNKLAASGTHLEGDTQVTSFSGLSSGTDGSIEANACLDISSVRAIDTNGQDVTAAGRSDVYAVRLRFVGGFGSLLISSYAVDPGVAC